MSRKYAFFFLLLQTKDQTPHYIFILKKLKSLIECTAVTDIDTSGIHALEELLSNLKKRETQVNYLSEKVIIVNLTR